METKELLNVLEKVKPGIASKNVIESMTYFYFSGTDIITYNDQISIQHPFKTKFNLFVKAQDLYKLISKLTEKEIKIEEKDGKLSLTCKTLKANLNTMNDPEVIERIKNVSDSLNKAEWKSLPENFCDSITLCSFSTSTRDSDGTLTCVHIDGKHCVSSDNNRISHAILTEEMDNMFIKATEIKNLDNIRPTQYSVTKSWLHFKNADNCIFSIRKITGEFPAYLQFFNFEGKEVNLPKEILEGINLTSILAGDSNPAIKFKIAKGFCMLSSNSDAGTITHRSKIKYNDEEINFTINPDFLKQMMSHSSTITVGEDKAKLQTGNSFSLLTLFFS